MTKKELISAVAAEAGVSAKVAASVVDGLISALTNELANGNDVSLAGFGSFKIKTRAAREGRNPRTKEIVKIPESKAVVFKPAACIKETVNK